MPNAIDTTQQKISKVDKLKELKELLDTVLQTEEKKNSILKNILFVHTNFCFQRTYIYNIVKPTISIVGI